MITPKKAVIRMERPFCVTARKTFCRSGDLVMTSSRWKANQNGETSSPSSAATRHAQKKMSERSVKRKYVDVSANCARRAAEVSARARACSYGRPAWSRHILRCRTGPDCIA